MSATPSRRSLLQLAGLGVVAGACTSHPAAPKPVDPDVALRAAAVAREVALLSAYDALPAPTPAQAAVRADHVAHLAALQRTASPTPSSAATRPTDLVAAEREAAAAHARDALSASGSLAALLASLAASEASHPVALS